MSNLGQFPVGSQSPQLSPLTCPHLAPLSSSGPLKPRFLLEAKEMHSSGPLVSRAEEGFWSQELSSSTDEKFYEGKGWPCPRKCHTGL